VAARLAALCLDPRGRLTAQLLAADAVRCGLLVDLARAGRVRLAHDSVTVDAVPTGFPPADDLLLAMQFEPERTLDAWFGDHRLGLSRVVDALVGAGRWEAHRRHLGRRRYSVRDQGRVDRDKNLDLSLPASAWTPEDAAVAALGSTAHLVGRFRRLGYVVPPPEITQELLHAAGPQEWILTAGVDHLRTTRARYLYRDSALSSGGSFT
jgi:hypothetical protein